MIAIRANSSACSRPKSFSRARVQLWLQLQLQLWLGSSLEVIIVMMAVEIRFYLALCGQFGSAREDWQDCLLLGLCVIGGLVVSFLSVLQPEQKRELEKKQAKQACLPDWETTFCVFLFLLLCHFFTLICLSWAFSPAEPALIPITA